MFFKSRVLHCDFLFPSLFQSLNLIAWASFQECWYTVQQSTTTLKPLTDEVNNIDYNYNGTWQGVRYIKRSEQSICEFHVLKVKRSDNFSQGPNSDG